MWVDRDEPEEGESPYDLADAFLDAMEFGEDNQDGALVKICKLILIELGYYVPMSQKEIENSYVTRGTVWDFKLKGIPYKGVDSWLEK
jgi:dimeric dUTPase (all-alpha-NTP-PPase superfamily)